MATLVVQLAIISALLVICLLWLWYFPYPSPVIRRWLPPRKRWPQRQVREWLAAGRFQTAFLQYFYRDPERVPPPGSSILAPADGRVSSTDVRDGIRYIVIALTFWDMHTQRSPLAGTVTEVKAAGTDLMDGEGRHFVFLQEKSCPVQKRIALSTTAGDIGIRLITSLAARRIEAWVNEGDRIERGDRIGRILLGSTVVLELPEATPVLVQVGDRVRAGETPIAEPQTS